jgi:predicted metal-dependent phosphotriesterase family hydrolase
VNVITEISNEQSFFAVFCIESVADELKMSGDIVYKMLAKESDILDNYIIECYDVLHTQGKEYIVDDIISFMKERGVLK